MVPYWQLKGEMDGIKYFTIVCSISFVLLQGRSSIEACPDAPDPCDTASHQDLPFTTDRCPTCIWNSSDRCDLNDVKDGVWYRANYPMTTEEVLPYECGSKYPIYLKDTVPAVGDGVVSKQTCLATFTSACLQEYEIKIKNCGSFQTYCFIDLPSGCQQRFCFNYPKLTTTTVGVTTTLAATDHDKSGTKSGPYTIGKDKLLFAILALSLLSTLLVVVIAIMCYDRRRTNQELEAIKVRASRLSVRPDSARQAIGASSTFMHPGNRTTIQHSMAPRTHQEFRGARHFVQPERSVHQTKEHMTAEMFVVPTSGPYTSQSLSSARRNRMFNRNIEAEECV